MTHSGHEAIAFAAMHGPDLLYLIPALGKAHEAAGIDHASRWGGSGGTGEAAGGEAMKMRRRNTTKLKRREKPAAPHRRGPTAADLQKQLDQRTRELAEALKQQAATSEVLGVISRSPGELERVFQAMLENAIRICGAKFGILFRYEGGVFHPAAMTNVPPAFADFLDRQGSFAPVRGRLFGRLAQTKKVIHVIDRATEPTSSPSVRYGGARSAIGVPMLKGKELVGAFFIYHTEVRPFTDKQIELVKNFAAQAVIAIENARQARKTAGRTGKQVRAGHQRQHSQDARPHCARQAARRRRRGDRIGPFLLRLLTAAFGTKRRITV